MLGPKLTPKKTVKPVAIFRHVATEGPGYFATYLSRHEIPWRVLKIDEGEPVPGDPREFSGLVFMGGPMSVNDGLPWIAPTLRLIHAAVDAGIPVLGHCLGGQLIAKALGKRVNDLTVVVLDRPRHEALVKSVRSVGAKLRMIGDGDDVGFRRQRTTGLHQ